MTTAKVAISADFLTAFAHLPRQVQGKVTELVNKFRNDPASPGIHYEKINSCSRFFEKAAPKQLTGSVRCGRIASREWKRLLKVN